MNPSRVSPFAEFRALLRTNYGSQEQVARVAGMCPRRLSNCLNPHSKHTLTVDEFFDCTEAATALGLPGWRAFSDSLVHRLLEGSVTPADLDGSWIDEPLEVIDSLVGLLREHSHTPGAKDLPNGARSEIVASIDRAMEVLNRCKQELAQ